jgi:hypothetical protein
MYVKIGNYPENCDQEREITVEIHEYDTWNMDETLAHIVTPMLKQLAKNKHGGPLVDIEDVPQHLRPSKKEIEAFNYDGTTDENFFKRWEWVMGEMIFAFECKLHDWDSVYWTHDDEVPNIEFEPEGPAQLRLFPDEKGNTVDYEYYSLKSTGVILTDPDKRQQQADRIENGLRLFGKYYQSLWD